MVDNVDCYVSLWAGDIDSDKLLSDYISYEYEEERFSPFEDNFKIYNLDEDCVERIFLDEKTDSLKKLLSGCSYEDKVIPEFEKILSRFPNKNYNFAILVYDMDYDGNITMADDDYYWIRFIGTVKIKLK